MLKGFKKILFSDLFKSISIYTIFRLINRSLPVLLLPFLTIHLTPKDYSIIDIFTNLCYITLPIIGLNSYSSTSRFYYDKSINYKIFLSTVIKFTLITYVLISIILIITNNYILEFINVEKFNFFLLIVATYSLFEQIFLIHTTNLRLEEKKYEYGFIGLIRTILELVGTILLILYFINDWRGRILGQAIGLIIVSIYSTYILFKEGYISSKFSIVYLKESLVFGFPLIIHTISGILLGFSNRYFIIKYVGLEEAGVFASAYQLCFIISLLHTSFNEAWVPYLFKSLSNNDSLSTREKLVKITYLYFFILFILTIIFILIMPLIYKFIGKSFQINFINIVIISFAFLLNGFYKMLVNYLFYTKKTFYVALGTIIALLFNLVLNYYFIIQFKILGASIALFLTFFLHFLIFLFLVNMNFKLPWFYFINSNKLHNNEKNL